MPDIIARILGDGKGFDKAVSTVQGKLKTLKSALGSLGIGLGVSQLVNWSSQLIKAGSHLTDVADKLGVSTDFLQEFNFMATQNGISTRASEMGLQRFTRRLGEAQNGLGEMLPIIREYNVQLRSSDGTMRTASEVMADFADIIRSTHDPQERLRIAFKLFDSEGAALVNVLSKGSAGMREMQSEAQKLGQVISEDTLRKMDQTVDNMDIFIRRMRTGVSEVLGFLLEHEDDFAPFFTKGIWGVLYRNNGSASVDTTGPFDAMLGKIREMGELSREATLEAVRQEQTLRKQEAIQSRLNELVRKGVDDLVFKNATTVEQLEIINQRIVEQANIVNDTSLTEKERTAAQKILNTLMGQQVDLAQQMGQQAQEELDTQEKKAEALRKQKEELASQRRTQEELVASIKGQFDAFPQQNLTPTFGDFVSGSVGSRSQQGLALDIADKRAQISDMIARGFSQENINRSLQNLQQLEERFEATTGGNVDINKNPFKEALKDAEDRLQEIVDEFQGA